MTIIDEVPGLKPLHEQLTELWETNFELWNAPVENPSDLSALPLDEYFDLQAKIDDCIAAYKIDDCVMQKLRASIEEDDGNKLLKSVSIVWIGTGLPPDHFHGQWFSRHETEIGAVMDTKAVYAICHPALWQFAKDSWGDSSRIKLYGRPPKGGHEAKRLASLKAHGVPKDGPTRMWALEALNLAKRGLEVMSIDWRLCDYVEWTCSGEPPNISLDAEFGEATFAFEANFGDRLSDEPNYRRIGGCCIWEKLDGSFISPLWEYLTWRSNTFTGFEELSRTLGEIGEGIDAAVLVNSPESDPAYSGRIGLDPYTFFQAGQAMVRLRLKLEMEDTVQRGHKAEALELLRARKTGKASADARKRRIADLLAHMERLARENPMATRLGDTALAKFAVEDAQKENAKLWAQGAGQIEDYLGEVRRGEAGHDAQSRYLVIFPKAQNP